MSNSYSVSRFSLSLEISNRGSAQCEIIRHLSPLTVGTEKQKTQFRRGDIAYMTSNSSICVFIKDSSYTPMNPIGIVKSNIELMESTDAGDIMVLKR